MITRNTQIEGDRNGRVMLNVPKKSKSDKPFRVTLKTGATADNLTAPECKARLSADIPLSSLIAVKNYANSMHKHLYVVVDELIRTHCIA